MTPGKTGHGNALVLVFACGFGLTAIGLLIFVYAKYAPIELPAPPAPVTLETTEQLIPQADPELTFITNAETRQAVCMDGTPAAYYLRPGRDDGANNWIIFLEGGSSCHDAAGCEASRKDPDFSSGKLKASKKTAGILDSDPALNPDFYNWNQVFLNNCNAGNWGGDDEVEINGRTYSFNGYSIITAVLEDVVDPETVERVIFAGSSGGGTGVAQNLDRVAGMFPQANVMGVIDSSYELDYPPFAAVKAVDPSAGFSFADTYVDETCETAFPTEPWQCLIKDKLYPYLSTPVFTYQDLIDSHKLEDNGITDLSNPEQAAWNSGYIAALTASLALLDGVYAPKIGEHMALPNDRFTTAKIGNYTFAEILGNWVFDRSGPTNVISK
jgi:hypothetical protein